MNNSTNRQHSISSSHLPRVTITSSNAGVSTRTSGGDTLLSVADRRKLSFLSADGRLEERRASQTSRRSSKDSSRGSFESDGGECYRRM